MMVDLMCLMHECEERGFLATAGTAWPDEDIARAAGGDFEEALQCLRGLVGKGALSRDNRGAVYSRRMARDEHKRAACTAAGYRGGNPTLKGQSKGGVKGQSKGQPTPSYSVSVSNADSDAVASKASAAPPPARASPAKPAATTKFKKRKRTRTDQEHRTWFAFRREFCESIWPKYHAGLVYDFDSEDRPQRRGINYEALWRFLDHDAIAWDVEKARQTADYFAQFCADHNPCWDVPLQRLARKAEHYWQKSLLPRSTRVIGNAKPYTINSRGEFASDLPTFGRPDPGQGGGVAAAG
jgi:hypothetical protein